MNTLSPVITARILIQSNTYTTLRRHWIALMNSDRRHELSAAHHLLYLALLGKDWRKSFAPPTNRRKLENGALYGWKLYRALDSLHLKHFEQELLTPFDGIISAETLARLRLVLPAQNAYAYRSEQFAQGVFPFDAYVAPEVLADQFPEGGNSNAG